MGPNAATATQEAVNDAVWSGHGFLSSYANRDLRPVEVVLLLRYREALAGRVLELGCGAGRITGYLVELSGDVLGIDVSDAMIAHCRERYPAATFAAGDLRDLSAHPDGAFDAIVAGNNVLDVLGDADRCAALRGFRRVLAPGGVLVFSSHNRAYAPRLRTPLHVQARNPLRLVFNVVRLPRRLRNRRRLLGLEETQPGYAILNDEAHDYTLLHYYIGRDEQARQLAQEGFELLECLAIDAQAVGEGARAETCSELHYVARRTAG